MKTIYSLAVLAAALASISTWAFDCGPDHLHIAPTCSPGDQGRGIFSCIKDWESQVFFCHGNNCYKPLKEPYQNTRSWTTFFRCDYKAGTNKLISLKVCEVETWKVGTCNPERKSCEGCETPIYPYSNLPKIDWDTGTLDSCGGRALRSGEGNIENEPLYLDALSHHERIYTEFESQVFEYGLRAEPNACTVPEPIITE